MISPKIYTPMKILLAVDGSEQSFTAAQFICDLPLPEVSENGGLGRVISTTYAKPVSIGGCAE